MIRLILSIFLLSICWGQDTLWFEIPDAPVATSELKKHDDLFFRNDSTGWLVTRSGEIFRTADGGISWLEQLHDTTAYLRCIGFLDDYIGIAGNLKADSLGNTLYRTTNAGISWHVVDSSSISGDYPSGMCGLFVVDSSTIYGCGRVFGPAFFVRSFDGGETWESFNMSDSVGMLIDLYFWDQNHGIMIGGSDADRDSSQMLILYTDDAGNSWETVYLGNREQEWGWKISFPTETIGYVSIQKKPYTNATTEYFLKTTDGGFTWFEFPFMFADTAEENVYSALAMGFITPTRGWMGSYINDRPTLMTEDGGVTWTEAGFGRNVNRIRFLHPWLGYASGRTVYKYVDSTAMSINGPSGIAGKAAISQNYPNPFNPRTVIPYQMLQRGKMNITIYNIKGQKIRTLVSGFKNAGNHQTSWDGKNDQGLLVASGHYFCRMIVNNKVTTRKILLLR